jgi:hypothetical protein
MLPAAVSDQPLGDVVTQAFAVLAAVAGCQTITGFIKELACQR